VRFWQIRREFFGSRYPSRYLHVLSHLSRGEKYTVRFGPYRQKFLATPLYCTLYNSILDKKVIPGPPGPQDLHLATPMLIMHVYDLHLVSCWSAKPPVQGRGPGSSGRTRSSEPPFHHLEPVECRKLPAVSYRLWPSHPRVLRVLNTLGDFSFSRHVHFSAEMLQDIARCLKDIHLRGIYLL